MFHQDWSIVLIGKVLTKLEGFDTFGNIFFLGPRPYQLLPNYLKAFDVCIIPYMTSDGSIFKSSPVKLKEYLAAGKPIVSTPIPEVEKFNKVVKMANSKDEFVKSIESLLKENGREKIQTRQEVVKKDDWNVKAEEFSKHIEAMLEPGGNPTPFSSSQKGRDVRSKKITIMHLSSVKGAGGGPDKTILLSAKKIDRERFNPVIVYLKGKNDSNFSIEQKAKEKNLTFYAISEKRKIDWQAFHTLKNLLAEHRVDILHCHGYKADCLGLFLSRGHKMKLVTTTHGWFSNDLKEKFYNWLDKKTLKHYDRVITVCDKMRHYLLNMGIPSHKLITIHNAVDTDDFKNTGSLEDLRPELNLDKNTSIIGIIGRLSKEKRIEILFPIAKKVILKAGNVQFLIVGDGPLKERLKLKTRNLNLEENILFLGQRNDIKRVYKTIDLLVSLSSTEGLSNVILEAQSCEVPVVATKVGGNSEIIKDRTNGLLFPPEDINGIANGIISLLSNREMALKFTQEGRKLMCKKFSFDERMKKIEKEYLEVMKEK